MNEINELHERMYEEAREALTHAIEAGNILLEVKAHMSHAEFLPWVMGNCKFRVFMAERYMKVAKKYKRKELPEGNELFEELLKLTEEYKMPKGQKEAYDRLYPPKKEKLLFS